MPYPILLNDTEFVGKMYSGSVISFLGKTLGYFSANGVIIKECREQFKKDGTITGGCKEVLDGSLVLRLPYFNNGKYAEIYDPNNKKILTIDLSLKATCNENNRCEPPVEDNINCSVDCKEKAPASDITATNTEFPDYFTDRADQPEEITLQAPWWQEHIILISVLLFVILVFFIFFRNLII